MKKFQQHSAPIISISNQVPNLQFTLFIIFLLGWSKSYEFNESDLKVACDMLDTWIDATSLGRTNLPPDRVPWKAILTLLSQCIYGGKIDNEFDQRLLLSFLEKLFNAKCFEVTICLFSFMQFMNHGPKKIEIMIAFSMLNYNFNTF